MLFNLKHKDKETSNLLLSLNREDLLAPLQLVSGIIEKRHTMPILSNVLLAINGNALTITGTDSEIELVGKVELENAAKEFNPLTLPGRKLMDICRTLPEKSNIEFHSDTMGRIILSSGASRFTLTSLPATDFPLIPEQNSVIEFKISQKILKNLANKTYFIIPQNDARTYLNGMLLETKDGIVKAVASDCISLALNSVCFSEKDKLFAQVIIPRKAVMELIRLFDNNDEEVTIGLNSNYIKISGGNFTFTSKLISGKFPNYNSLIPRMLENKVVVNRLNLKQALQRISILSNETLREFRLSLTKGILRLSANNSEHEEALEELAANYNGENLDIAFNISSLLDILNGIDSEQVAISLKDGNNLALVEGIEDENNLCSLYVIMPIRRK